MESEITDLFADKLALARRAHVSTSLRRLRSDFAHHVFVSTVALFIREARADPQRFAANLKTAEIRASKAKRTEVLALRLATNDPAYRDPKAANAAAYLACPPNGDPPPPTVRACVRYIRQTQNGLRGLSDLYAAAVAGETPEPPVLEEWAESQLDGIAPDLTFEHEAGDDVPLYTLSLTWCTDDEVHLWLLDPDDPKIRRAITQIKKRAITDNPKAWADASIVARYQRQAPPPAAPVDAQEALAAFVQEHLPGAVVSFEAVPVEPEAAPAKNEAATDRTAGYHGCLCCVGVMPPIHTSLSEAEALLRKSFEAGKTSGKKDGIEEVLASWERSKLVRIGKDETGIIHVQLWKNEEWVDEAYCPNIPDAICKAFEIVQLGVIEREQVPEPPPAEPEPEKAEVKAETPAPVAEPKTEVSVAEPVAALDPLAVLRHKLTNGDLDGVIHDGSVLIHGDAFGVLSPEPVARRLRRQPWPRGGVCDARRCRVIPCSHIPGQGDPDL